MLIPAPPPAYTLAPGVGPLDRGQQRALDACLAALTGRHGAVVVTGVGTTLSHHVIELVTATGSMLVLERVADETAATLAPAGALSLD